MNNIEYNLGILDRLVAGTVNGKPYVLLDDAKYIVKNSGICILKKDNNSLYERRSAAWPYNYDDIDVQDYHEWFIKGTNIKLGFDYVNGKLNEHEYYCTVSESYDDQIPFNSEKDLTEHFEWMIMNDNLIWRYYE